MPTRATSRAAVALLAAAVAVVALLTGFAAAATPIGAATATVAAARGSVVQERPFPVTPSVDNPLLAGCDVQLLQRLMMGDPTVAQWIMVVVPSTSSTTGTLAIATVHGSAWECTLTPTVARVGRQGIRPLVQRRSGDDTTPSGIFPLGVVSTPQGPITFFGNSADPGVHGAYRLVQPGDCYGANPNTPGYGHWRVDRTTCTGADELLARNVHTYEHAVIIGANTEPNVSGDAPGEPAYAAAIFLHHDNIAANGSTLATSGCVSIGHDQLITAMTTIDPALNPRFAIGTRADLLAVPPRYSAAWLNSR